MTSFGTVQTHVFASRANLPLAGAAVVVTRRTGPGRNELLAIRQTDSSGTTAPVSIPTPAANESLSPGQGSSFAYVDITADLPGYSQVIVRDVQVFPGVLTLQEIQMVPRDPQSGLPGGQEFFVTPQNL